VTARLRETPGVRSVSTAMLPLLGRGNGFVASAIEGYSPAPDERMRFESNFVGPGFFETAGIAVRAGRDFSEADREGQPLVAVVSNTMARRYWAGRDPVGRRITSSSFPTPVTIVGVVNDVAVGVNGTAEPFVYFPVQQHPRFLQAPVPILWLARTTRDHDVASSMRAILRQVDPAIPMMEITTLDQEVRDLLMPQRLGSTLLSSLGVLTLLLVATGVTGSVAYNVALRNREIGIRIALGGTRVNVAATLTRSALIAMACGLCLGLPVTFGLTRLVGSFLYGIQPTDPIALSVAIGSLAGMAAMAALVPAWRAARMQPGVLLSAE
jgi:hypothetical protein